MSVFFGWSWVSLIALPATQVCATCSSTPMGRLCRGTCEQIWAFGAKPCWDVQTPAGLIHFICFFVITYNMYWNCICDMSLPYLYHSLILYVNMFMYTFCIYVIAFSWSFERWPLPAKDSSRSAENIFEARTDRNCKNNAEWIISIYSTHGIA